MTILTQQRPPLLMHADSAALSALEAFLLDSQPGLHYNKTTQPLDAIIDTIRQQVEVGNDYNCYIFVQYSLYLYMQIFTRYATSWVYRDHLDAILTAVGNAGTSGQVTDRLLLGLLRNFAYPLSDTTNRHELVQTLESIQVRLQPERAYPGIETILKLVYALYDTEPYILDDVLLYQTVLRQLEGYDKPALVLVPACHTTLNTTHYTGMSDLYWKFVYSLNIPDTIDQSGSFLDSLYLLARMALPLDPIQLTTAMNHHIMQNQQTAIPFCNYIAMYLKQRILGFDYQISRLADTRRLLMKRLHRFCGVGATTINDLVQARAWIDTIRVRIEATDPPLLDDDERDVFAFLSAAVSYTETNVPFVRGLYYESSVEAAAVANKKPTQSQKAGDDDTTGAFADDAQTVQNNPTPPSDPVETDDDTIDQTGNNSPPVMPSISTLLPLALPSETIDDHLFRITVLQYIAHLNTIPNPDISADALRVMNTWCESWLFLAAIKITKQLLAQLKLTGHLKEFAA